LHTNNAAFRNDNGKWKVLSKEGASMTVEVSYQEVHVHPGKDFVFPARTETYYLTIASRTELLRRTRPEARGGFRYKRI
jgi:hypothetical protein